MNRIKIKDRLIDGSLVVETYDTDTYAVCGFTLKTSDLWHWLEECQPCQVDVHVNDASLQRLVRDAGRSISDVYVDP